LSAELFDSEVKELILKIQTAMGDFCGGTMNGDG
jgi:hypothetical protein